MMNIYQVVVRGTKIDKELKACMASVRRYYPKRKIIEIPRRRAARCYSAVKDHWLWNLALTGEDFLYIDLDVVLSGKLDCGDGSRVACGETSGQPDTMVYRSFGIDISAWEDERKERGISNWGRCFPRKILREKDVYIVRGFEHLYRSRARAA